ncbi:hypothetical protein HBI73_074320 [Parastagonospora nodorum]|nr:hypothetical protein HBI75_008620 [Parastagonospora nodorum]KAH5141588.1 hypothetical protein HBI73_074320 [Parastagonospora nodorum]
MLSQRSDQLGCLDVGLYYMSHTKSLYSHIHATHLGKYLALFSALAWSHPLILPQRPLHTIDSPVNTLPVVTSIIIGTLSFSRPRPLHDRLPPFRLKLRNAIIDLQAAFLLLFIET